MNDKFFKHLFENSSFGYVHYRAIVDEKGLELDYEFIKINRLFEEVTGISKNQIINNRLSSINPNFSSFDWLYRYNGTNIDGVLKEIEYYTGKNNKCYNATVVSPAKNNFLIIFKDITDWMKIANISKEFMEQTEEKIDYKKMCDDILELSGAKYVAFNLFNKGGINFKTVAISGSKLDIDKACAFLGFKLDSKIWKYNTKSLNKIKQNTIVHFNSIHELSDGVLPSNLVKIMEKTFKVGQVYIAKIVKDNKFLGDFTIIMPNNKIIKNKLLVELYSSQVGLYIEKKKTEEAFIDSQKKYYYLAENSASGIVLCDYQCNIRYANSSAIRLLKLDKFNNEKRGNLLNNKFLIDKGISNNIAQHLKENRSVKFELNYISDSGEKIWLVFYINIENQNKANDVNIRVVDVSASRNYQEKLRYNEQNFRSFFQAINDMIFILNKKGQIIHTNNVTTRRMGYTLDELKQMNVRDVHPKSSVVDCEYFLNNIIKGNTDIVMIPLYTKKGIVIQVEIKAWIGKWNNEECIFAIAKDLTKEQESLQKFNKLFKRNPALMAVNDIESGIFTDVNDAFIDKIGYSREEIIGNNSSDLNLFPEQEKQLMIAEELKITGHINNYELKVRTKDGKLLDGLFSGEIIESKGKNYFLTVMVDITELRKSQEKIDYLAFHDQLTGLYNRRFYEEELKRLDTKRNLPLSLVILDVNGLKLINDGFGHLVGDELLKTVANVMKKKFRADDIIARIDGDEFIIILPKTDSDKVKVIVKRLNESIEKKSIANINISVAYGWDTKIDEKEDIVNIYKRAEEYMYRRKLFESTSMRYKTIEVIMNTLCEKNIREQKHSKRVSELSGLIGLALNLSKSRIKEIETAGLMHDIGKTAIDDKILNKPDKLDKYERDEIRRHPEIGYRILSSVNEYALLAKYVLAHHERWDGKGYPEGLKGKDIPLVSRIIAVADSYDAMTNDRPYRKALDKKVAIQEIIDNSEIKYDPEIVKVFIEKVLPNE